MSSKSWREFHKTNPECEQENYSQQEQLYSRLGHLMNFEINLVGIYKDTIMKIVKNTFENLSLNIIGYNWSCSFLFCSEKELFSLILKCWSQSDFKSVEMLENVPDNWLDHTKLPTFPSLPRADAQMLMCWLNQSSKVNLTKKHFQ